MKNVRTERPKTSRYLSWAKEHHGVRYNLASSGVPAPSPAELGMTPEDWTLTEEHEDGWMPLRERIAERYGVSPDQVALAQGTSMANHLVCALLLEAGDHALVEHPCYEPLRVLPEFFGAEVRFFERSPKTGYALEATLVEEKLTPRTRLVILSNLHNPTGQLASRDALERLAEVAERLDVHILVDEVYLEWLHDDGEKSATTLSPRYITTRSLTKVYGLDAVRGGWVLAEAETAERVRRLMDLYSVKMAHASERLAAKALERAGTLLFASKKRLAENRRLVEAFIEAHPRLSWTTPSAGSVGLVTLEGGSVDALVRGLEARDALVTPGRFFGIEDAFRIGFGMDTATLKEGLARLDESLSAG